MGQLRKSSIHDDRSTDLQIETPIFGSNQNRYREILQSLHFCIDDEMLDNSSRHFQIESVIDYFLNQFDTVY